MIGPTAAVFADLDVVVTDAGLAILTHPGHRDAQARSGGDADAGRQGDGIVEQDKGLRTFLRAGLNR